MACGGIGISEQGISSSSCFISVLILSLFIRALLLDTDEANELLISGADVTAAVTVLVISVEPAVMPEFILLALVVAVSIVDAGGKPSDFVTTTLVSVAVCKLPGILPSVVVDAEDATVVSAELMVVIVDTAIDDDAVSAHLISLAKEDDGTVTTDEPAVVTVVAVEFGVAKASVEV